MIKKVLLLTIFAQLSLTANIIVNDLSKENTEIIERISSKITLKNKPIIQFNNKNESAVVLTFSALPISIRSFQSILSINESLFDTYTKTEKEFIIARCIYAIEEGAKIQSLLLKTGLPGFIISITFAYLIYNDDSNVLKINKYMPWYQKNISGFYRFGIWLLINRLNATFVDLLFYRLKDNLLFDLDIQAAKTINSFESAISFLEKQKLILEKQIEMGDTNLRENLNFINKRITALQKVSLN